MARNYHITSDAESACFEGSRTSCDVIMFGIFGPHFGRKRSHHVMDASCRVGSPPPQSGSHAPRALGDQFLSSAGTGTNCALSMRAPNPGTVLGNDPAHMVQEFYPVLELGSGERLLWHFQTPVLHCMNFCLRCLPLLFCVIWLCCVCAIIHLGSEISPELAFLKTRWMRNELGPCSALVG